MKTTTLTRKLPALVLALAGGQVALASGASAQVGLFAPRPSPTAPAAAPAAPAAPTMLQVEQKLAALKYDVGPADGQTDDQTVSAIMAFQKTYGLERTGGLPA